jgi:hypothetical protein
MDMSDQKMCQRFKAPGSVTNRVTEIKIALLLLLLLVLKCLHFGLQLLRFLGDLTDKNRKDLGRTSGKCISIFVLRMNFLPCFIFG